MRFPLDKRQIGGYSFWQKTSYSAHHLGVDYSASLNTPLYAPTDGSIVYTGYGKEGGNWLHFKDSNGKIWRFGHLNSFVVKSSVKEGTRIAYTGNTGSLTTTAHLHLDIWNKTPNLSSYTQSDLIDPEIYIKVTNNQGGNMTAKVYQKNGDSTIWLYFHGIKYPYKSWDEFIKDGWVAANVQKVDSLPDALDPELIQSQLGGFEITIKSLDIEITDLKSKFTEIEGILSKTEKARGNLEIQVKELTPEIETLTKKLMTKSSELLDLQIKYKELKRKKSVGLWSVILKLFNKE